MTSGWKFSLRLCLSLSLCYSAFQINQSIFFQRCGMLQLAVRWPLSSHQAHGLPKTQALDTCAPAIGGQQLPAESSGQQPRVQVPGGCLQHRPQTRLDIQVAPHDLRPPTGPGSAALQGPGSGPGRGGLRALFPGEGRACPGLLEQSLGFSFSPVATQVPRARGLPGGLGSTPCHFPLLLHPARPVHGGGAAQPQAPPPGLPGAQRAGVGVCSGCQGDGAVASGDAHAHIPSGAQNLGLPGLGAAGRSWALWVVPLWGGFWKKPPSDPSPAADSDASRTGQRSPGEDSGGSSLPAQPGPGRWEMHLLRVQGWSLWGN